MINLALNTDWADEKDFNIFVQNNLEQLVQFKDQLPALVRQLPLGLFNEYFIYRYDKEAEYKSWRYTEFQNILGNIWRNSAKSRVLAPREHLKTHTALSYAIKRIYTRKYPLEINYYHISSELASEKIRKMQRVIERNPLLHENFDLDHAKSWSEQKMELSDGTVIVPLSYQQGVVGKHPHIIILDDIIDVSILYSDEQNKKSIEKFYTNIYPQISKEDKDKKIIIIGTAQRADDLYHKLPADFSVNTFSAIVNEEKKILLSPEIFTWDKLMQIKADISLNFGEKFWLKEYMNVPLASLGIIVKDEYIQYYDEETDISQADKKKWFIIQGWDLAVGKDIEKGDWTVGMTLGIIPARDKTDKVKIYVLDIIRARLDFGQRLKAIRDYYNKWQPHAVGVEEVAFQYDTIQTARNMYALPIYGVKAIKNKIESFQVEVGPYFENKQVYLLKDKHQDFRTELLSLPVGEYDDQADAFKIAVKTYIFNSAGKLTDKVKTEEGEGYSMGNLLEETF